MVFAVKRAKRKTKRQRKEHARLSAEACRTTRAAREAIRRRMNDLLLEFYGRGWDVLPESDDLNTKAPVSGSGPETGEL